MTPRKRSQRGYTIVELMMSLTVLALGTSGVIAMQKVTLSSNSHAKNLVVANSIAMAWADTLAADATQWNHATDLDETVWLNGVPATAVGNWIRPVYNSGRAMGAAFGPLGNPLPDSELGLATYCTDLRFARLHRDDVNPGSGLIRAEIRVIWRRANSFARAGTAPASLCSATDNDPAAVDDIAEEFHFVFITTAIGQTGTGS